MENLQQLDQKNLSLKVQDLFAKHGPLCNSEGFYQHEGECWNDALQMIFLYSDGFKEHVQKKLATAPVDPAEIDELFRPEAESILQTLETEEKKKISKNTDRIQFGLLYVGLIYEYLKSLQKRFIRHYAAEFTRLSYQKVCSLEEMKGEKVLKQLRQISLAFRGKEKEGLLSGFFGQEIQLKNLEERRDPKKMQDIYIPGGTTKTEKNVIHIFTKFFELPFHLSEIRISITNKIVRYSEKTTSTPMNVSAKTAALFCGVGKGKNSHAVSFYACGGREYYYDDNHGTIEFPWRKFFAKLQDRKTNSMIEAQKAWKRKTDDKSKNSTDGFMDYEIYFNGAFTIKNKNGNKLFTSYSYPYLYRVAWEKSTKTLLSEYSTLLWNGEEIVKLRTTKDYPSYTKTFTTEGGEQLTYNLEFEKAEDILGMVLQFDLTEDAKSTNVSFKESGSLLGSRIYSNDTMISEIAIETQLAKVKAGKADIDDIFYSKVFKFTPLMMAIYIKNIPLMKRILQMGADPNKKIDNRSPLYYAVGAFDIVESDILELLLKAGADINDSNNGISGFTPLMGCILGYEEDEMLEAIEFLLDHGADLNIKTKRFEATAIEYAIFMKRFPPIIDALVKHGATLPTCPTKEKLLQRVGLDSYMMTLIREGKHIQAGNLAKCYREYEIYDALNYENMVGDTALKLAISYPSPVWTDELIDYLANNGADVNYVDRFGNTPLHYAIELRKKDAVKKLLDNGAKPNVIVKGYGSALMHAIKIEDQDMIESITEYVNKPRYKKVEYATRKIKKQLPTPPKQNLRFKRRVTIRKAKASNINASK